MDRRSKEELLALPNQALLLGILRKTRLVVLNPEP